MARTLREAIAEITSSFEFAGVDNPRLDARLLIAHVLNIESAQTFVRGDVVISNDQETQLAQLVARRIAREPVSRIIGKREFWGLDLNVTPDTLDPRPDTEVVVQAAIEHCARLNITAPRIADLGTGTGCIALALLQALPDATAIGTDINAATLCVAHGNAQHVGLENRISFVCSSWADALRGAFDVIVSNPPYLSADDMNDLSPEVRFDPTRALFGGKDGLECYRAIIPDLKRIVRTPAIACFEVGAGQASDVASMAESSGLRVVEVRSDLGSIPRCVVLQI